MWAKFQDTCLTVEGKPRKKPHQEIDPSKDRTRGHCVRSGDVTPRPQMWSDRYLWRHLSGNVEN